MNILEIKNVSKQFGTKVVLDQLNLSLPEGVIYGFVGENGAGKTTTMKLILGLEAANQGEIFVKGEKVAFGATKTNRITGFLPDVPAFYGYMTAKEYLTFCGEITGLNKQTLKQKVTEILSLVGLADDKRKISGYSRGMKQRLGIAQALLNDPELLICDEPTSALDPSGRREFLDLLASLRGRMTILFSTHILTDVERICDYVGILDDGKLKVSSPLEELKKTYAKKQIELTFEPTINWSTLETGLGQLQRAGTLIAFTFTKDKHQAIIDYADDYDQTVSALLAMLVAQNLFPISLRKIDPSLEAIFLEVTK